MGNFIFTITKCASNNLPPSFSPSNNDWLSAHSVETGLSLISVQRLWTRFQHLGCNNTGLWTPQTALSSTGKISKNEFQRKLVNYLHAPDQQHVTFYDFLNAAVWLEKSTYEDKLHASFALINDKKPITIDSFTLILILMFPSKKQEDIQEYVSRLFEMIGVENPKTKTKEICEEDFLFFLKSSVTREKLEEMFQFRVVPNLKPIINKTGTPRIYSDSFTNNINIPTDEQLEEIARMMGDRDHSKLASILGILQYDVSHLENIYRNNKLKVVCSILQEWKQKQGARASFGALKRALYLSGFTDIVNLIEFG